MINNSLNFHRAIYSLIIGLLFLVGIVSHGTSRAQTSPPRILLTWQANSYVPAGYFGKALPGPSSIVTASVEIIDQGKIADLSGNNIYWYLDSSLVGSGIGKKTVNIRAGSRALQETKLMVQIPGYKGGLLFKTIFLFIASPAAVIEAPYGAESFRDNSVAVKGVPYFYNVTDLSTLIFNWTVNGQSVPAATSTEEKSNLTVSINPDAAQGSRLDIGLTIRDPKERFYHGSGNLRLNLAK
ncbi:MAG: hypothetical protein AAB602_00960 [Patescibacteria group bacterium]